jgi:ribonuclease HII
MTSSLTKKHHPRPTLRLFMNIGDTEAGVDEAGRGCLMGRVYAAAVVMPTTFADDDQMYREIRDSKKISANKRKRLEKYIKETAVTYGVGHAEVDEIDTCNIYQATLKAMHRALNQLDRSMDRLLIDGDRFRPYLDKFDNYPSYSCVIRGDGEYLSIAAASILAKCARDDYVIKLTEDHAEMDLYGWKNNKGYGTKQHMEAIREHGITPFHRKSFAPCKPIT